MLNAEPLTRPSIRPRWHRIAACIAGALVMVAAPAPAVAATGELAATGTTESFIAAAVLGAGAVLAGAVALTVLAIRRSARHRTR